MPDQPVRMLTLVLAFLAWPLAAQAQDRAALRGFLTPPGQEARLNGGVLVATGRGPPLRLTTGYARFATHEPLSVDATFQLASGAKPFTAVAVLQLRDAGRLRLDQPVSRILPWFPYEGVTVRHLLNHTSGLPDLELFEPLVTPDKVVTGADLKPALLGWQRPLANAPGAAFRYSNINYQLLALIVETVSGQRFDAYMRTRVFDPAGMRSTFVLGDKAADRLPAPVANHVFALMYWTEPRDVRTLDLREARKLRPYRYETYNLGATVGDQNVFSTLDDLWRFDRALRRGLILSPASQREAYAPTRLADGSIYLDPEVYDIYQTRCSYGLGWEVCDHPRLGRIVGHAGYNRGIQTLLYRNLDRGQMVAVFDNGDSPDFAAKAASIVNLAGGESPLAIASARSLSRAYGARLVEAGPAAGLLLFNSRRGDTAHWAFTGPGLNRLGYDLLGDRRPALAEDVFRLNVTLHPDSADFLDSWGDGLAALGRRQDAAAAYRQALAIRPDAEETRVKLKSVETAAPDPE